MNVDRYAPAPDLSLHVTGHRTARSHFAAEYGAAGVGAQGASGPAVEVEVTFVRRLPVGGAHGGHKTVRWSVDVGAPADRPLRAQVQIAGRPRRFALSLVQGFVVEPLASLAAVRAGHVLLPAAALEVHGAPVLLLGRSRSGKTSVVARALAAGRRAWGDDQVLLSQDGSLRSWPRRLRVYPDLRFTAPAAVAALPRYQRARLHGLVALAALSRGWVAPSLPLSWSDLGTSAATGTARLHRAVVLERGGQSAELRTSAMELATVVEIAAEVLREQRARLREVLGTGWDAELARTERAEASLLRLALREVPVERWTVPSAWSAPLAVATLAARLGVDDVTRVPPA